VVPVVASAAAGFFMIFFCYHLLKFQAFCSLSQ